MKNRIYTIVFFIVSVLGSSISQIKYDFTITGFDDTDSSYIISCSIKNKGEDFTYLKSDGEDILFYGMEVFFVNDEDTLFIEQPDSSFVLYDIDCLEFSNKASVYLQRNDIFLQDIEFSKKIFKELDLKGCYEIHLYLYFKDYPHCDPELAKKLNVIDTDIHAVMFKCF